GWGSGHLRRERQARDAHRELRVSGRKKYGSHDGGMDVLEHATSARLDAAILGQPMEPAVPMATGERLPIPAPERGSFIRTSGGSVEVAKVEADGLVVATDGTLWVKGRDRHSIHAQYIALGEEGS